MGDGLMALAAVVLGVGAAQPQPVGLAACFGGAPETVAQSPGRIDALRIDERYLYWPNARMDLATRAVTSDAGHVNSVSDGRWMFEVTGKNELIGLEMGTGIFHTIVGRRPIEDYMGFSPLALDETYVYFSLGSGPIGRGGKAGLYRVLRDGAYPPEKLGPDPQAPTFFIVADGDVYWAEPTGLYRQTLAPDAPVEKIVSASDAAYDASRPGPPLRVVGGLIYYLAGHAIWSRPSDGSGAPTKHAAVGSEPVRDLIVVPPCLYWTTSRAIRRARLSGDPKLSQVIADERSYAGRVVSDGRFLYWADVRAGRILRAGPGATTRVPPPPPPLTSTAAGLPVVDVPTSTGADWEKSCAIHTGCQRQLAPLPACPPDRTGRPWSALRATAETLVGTTIAVRGRLYLGRSSRGITPYPAGDFEADPQPCSAGRCCNRESRPLVIGDDAASATEGVAVEPFDCRGDDSRLCCNAPAHGQAVVATGKLARMPGWERWTLSAAALCVAPARRR